MDLNAAVAAGDSERVRTLCHDRTIPYQSWYDAFQSARHMECACRIASFIVGYLPYNIPDFISKSLYVTTERGDAAATRILLDCYRPSRFVCYKFKTLFHNACRSGNINLVQMILDLHDYNVHHPQLLEQGMLYATIYGHMHIFKYLEYMRRSLTHRYKLNVGLIVRMACIHGNVDVLAYMAKIYKVHPYRHLQRSNIHVMKYIVETDLHCYTAVVSKAHMHKMIEMGMPYEFIRRRFPHLRHELRRIRRRQHILLYKYIDLPTCIRRMVYEFIWWNCMKFDTIYDDE
jgi:hypothetical protein